MKWSALQVKDAVANATMDEEEKQLVKLVEQATSEQLIAPDWAINMQLVDKINRKKG